jgi:hypothetical protein
MPGRGEFQPLADALYRERVLRARRTPPEQRMLDGARLFDLGCTVTLAGIRTQHPDWTEHEIARELRRRLALARRLEAISPAP